MKPNMDDATRTGLVLSSGATAYAYGFKSPDGIRQEQHCMISLANSACSLTIYLSPAEAREYAAKLITAADFAESGEGAI